MSRTESGADELQRIANVLGNTRLDALDGFTAIAIVRMIQACRASDWDITPADLTLDERHYASWYGRLNRAAENRLRALYR